MPAPSDAPSGSAATVPPPPGARGRLGFWQKRYLLRHHRELGDEALATADPEDPAPWRDAGELLARRGDRTKASQAFREALRLAPGDALASKRLDRVEQGSDLSLDQPGGLKAAVGDDGDLGAGGVGSPPQPPLPGDLVPKPGFDPARGGAAAPR